MEGTQEVRRGLGAVFMAAGLFHAGEMCVALLRASGAIAVTITARVWSLLYFGHFLFLVVGGLGYFGWRCARSGVFHYEALADFLIGLGVFVLLLTVAGALLAAGLAPAWVAVAPGALLFGFGLGLRRGRRFGFGPKA